MGSVVDRIIERLEAIEGDELTVAEVARAFGVTRNTVYNWHNKGSFPGGARIGGTLRFDKATVIEHVRRQQGEA